jgi:hypothetical protein
MNNYSFGSRGRQQQRICSRCADDNSHGFLIQEEQILERIFTRAALPGVLNGICSALDCQIGGVVSLVSLPGEDPSELTEIARNAALFGLSTICSADLFGEKDERLGSLSMYGCVPRSLSLRESRLIERARCLAALAIKLDMVLDQQRYGDLFGNRPVRGRVLPWPVSVN